MQDQRPVVLFGLDGADPELVERWIDDLPNLRRLKEGFFGDLESIHPPITVPAWICMVSGYGPDYFGISEVMVPEFENYDFEPVDSGYFEGKTMLNRSGKNIAFGIPGTSPVFPIRGSMVSGLKFLEPEFYPRDLEEEMKAETGIEAEYEKEGWETPLEERTDAFRWLLENKEFSRAFGVFQLIDVAMHHVSEEEELKPYYVRADEALGEVMELCEERNWNLVVASDHGSSSMKHSFFLNGWLREKGYLEYTEEKEKQSNSPVYRIGRKLLDLGLKPVLERAAGLMERTTGREWSPTSGTVMDNIDFENTEAFSFMTSGMNFGAVWIHDDRWPEGTVSTDEIKEKALEIREELEKEDLIKNVYLDEQRLEDEKMPDLLVEGREDVGVGPQTYPYPHHRSEAVIHEKRGLIAGKGPDFEEDSEISARITDVAPTLEALQGEVTPCDGDPVTQVLKDGEISYRSEELEGVDF